MDPVRRLKKEKKPKVREITPMFAVTVKVKPRELKKISLAPERVKIRATE